MANRMSSSCIALLSESLDLTFLKDAFNRLHPELDVRLEPHLGRYDEIDVAVCWMPPPGQLAKLPRLQFVQSLGAGVDHILADPKFPSQVPLCRVIDPMAATAMAAYVAWAVVHRHRGMGTYLDGRRRNEWVTSTDRVAPRYTVGIAGMGAMGTQCAQALTAIGYEVRGWSRTPRSAGMAGLTVFCGAEQMQDFLADCDALICLLPLTRETEGFLSGKVFSQLARGAHIVNVGRGGHLVERDLLDALRTGQVGAATLDVSTIEPLPVDHPFWLDARILITPHIATRSSADVIVAQTVQNLASFQCGQIPDAVVDVAVGY